MRVACLSFLVLLGAAVITLHLRDDRRLSPIDEVQHVDYVVKAGQLQIPRSGETDGAVARHEAACRGIEAAFVPPPCADANRAPNSRFPENAIDTAASDPPLYYVVTGLGARAAQGVFHLSSIVTAARLLGIAWLGAGVVVLWLAMGELGVGLVARAAVSALVITTPVVVHSDATVTSDALLILGGASALYAVLLWERRKLSAWVVLFVAALCGLAKIPCLLAVAAASLYLLVRAARGPSAGDASTRSRRETVRMALLSFGCALATAVVWLAIVSLRSIPGAPTSPSAALFTVTHLKIGQILSQTGALLSPVMGAPVLAPLQNQATYAIVTILNVLLLAACFGSAAIAHAGSRLEGIATSAASLMLVGGAAFVISIYLSQHQVLPTIPPRYGLALVPAAGAVLGLNLEKPWIRWGVAAFAAAASIFTVAQLATR